MPGLAKSAEVATPSTVTQSPTNTAVQGAMMEWEGVPIDLYRQFNVELGTVPGKEIAKLKDIYEWAKTKCEEPTIGNILQRINSIENQLGSPALGDKRWDKIWNWVKISRQMDDLDKRREALRRKWL